MDEELVGQLKEISGDTVAVCELCGTPADALTVVVMERRSSGVPESDVRVCASCLRQIEAGELPVEPADDDLVDAADTL